MSSSTHGKKVAAGGGAELRPEFIQQQREEFRLGRRHLANMMGEDPESFSQEDVDVGATFVSILGCLRGRMWSRCSSDSVTVELARASATLSVFISFCCSVYVWMCGKLYNLDMVQ